MAKNYNNISHTFLILADKVIEKHMLKQFVEIWDSWGSTQIGDTKN